MVGLLTSQLQQQANVALQHQPVSGGAASTGPPDAPAALRNPVKPAAAPYSEPRDFQSIQLSQLDRPEQYS